jgi:hypothetical protein
MGDEKIRDYYDENDTSAEMEEGEWVEPTAEGEADRKS